MSKCSFSLLLFLFIGFQLNAQTKIDSLRIRLEKTNNETHRFAILDTLTKEMIQANHPDQIHYLDTYIQLAQKRKEYDLMAAKSRFRIQQYIYKGQSKAALSLADSMLTFTDHFKKQSSKAHVLLKRAAIYFNQEQLKNAVKDYDTSATIFLKTTDSIFAADAFYFGAQAYDNLRDFMTALDRYKKAYQLYNILGDIQYASYVSNDLAGLYGRNGFDQKAIEERLSLINRVKKQNDYTLVAQLNFQISSSYYKLHDYKNQKKYIDIAYSFIDSVPEGARRANTTLFIHLGYATYYLDTDNLQKAKQYIDTSETLLLATGSPEYNETSVLFRKATYFQKIGRLQEAKIILEKILSKKRNISDIQRHLNAKKLLSDIYASQGLYTKAYNVLSNQNKLKDSIYTANKTNSFLFHQTQFEIERKEKEILQQQTEILQLENEKTIATNKRNNLFTGLCFVIIIVALIGFHLIQKEKTKRKEVSRKLASNEKELTLYTERLLQNSRDQEALFKEINYLKTELGEKVSVLNLQELASSKILTLDDWYTFKQKFIAVYPLFFSHIEKQGYKLTKSEERLVALEKLGLTSNEIANLLGISFDSVNTNRYRLRKKINAPKEIPIVDYLENTNTQKVSV